MSTLRDLQHGLRAALLGSAADAIEREIEPGGLTPAARLAIYRHHVATSLTEALKATYPVVCRLVHERFFAYAADAYLREQPPTGPCLFEFGESFGAFLRDFPPCRELPYLPDVARLEWAMNAALHAADAAPIDSGRLRAVPADAASRLTLVLHPSVTLLESPWPVHRIWRANQADDPDTAVDLAEGPARVEVRRLGDDVVLRVLDPPTFAFRRALARGDTLETAAAAALEIDPGFELARELHAILSEGLVVDMAEPSR